MKWGEHLEFLEKTLAPQLAAQGQNVKALDNRPDVEPHLITIWDAFASLDRDRSYSMGGPGPIPFSSIDRYARRYEIEDLESFDRFRRLIMAMDAVYLKHVDAQMKREAKTKNGNHP